MTRIRTHPHASTRIRACVLSNNGITTYMCQASRRRDKGEAMTIANCQTLERICATAGSDLYRGRRLTDGMPVLLKLPAQQADAAQLARLRREYLLLRSLNVAGIAKPLALVDERGHLALVLEAFS